MQYPYPRHINAVVKFYKVPIYDMFILIGAASSLMLFVMLIEVVFSLGIFGYAMLTLVLMIFGSYVLLRRVSKNKHPTFLLSWISYHFQQPKKVIPMKCKIRTTGDLIK